jgi:hypothetical protein
MKLSQIKTALFVLTFCCFAVGQGTAQQSTICVKAATTVRPTYVKVAPHKLQTFFKKIHGTAAFANMRIVKSELAYYLIASETGGSRIFAFELEQKRKKLYLNSTLPVLICEGGELSLDTFLQEDGKIRGCRMGPHVIHQGK